MEAPLKNMNRPAEATVRCFNTLKGKVALSPRFH